MQIRTLYRCLLSLPLLVPALLLPLGLLHVAPSWLQEFISISSVSIVVGGIPYALLVIGLLLWMRRRPERQIRMAMFSAPVLMVGFIGLGLLAMVSLDGSPFDTDVLISWAAYSGYALALGYFYVALACLVVWLARRTGRVDNEGET